MRTRLGLIIAMGGSLLIACNPKVDVGSGLDAGGIADGGSPTDSGVSPTDAGSPEIDGGGPDTSANDASTRDTGGTDGQTSATSCASEISTPPIINLSCGVCVPGETRSDESGCGAGEVRVTTCDLRCQFGAYSACRRRGDWTVMAPSPLSPRWNFSGVTGASGADRFFVHGGEPTPAGAARDDGAVFDPVTDTWGPVAVGSEAAYGAAAYTLAGFVQLGGHALIPDFSAGGLLYAHTNWTAAVTDPITGARTLLPSPEFPGQPLARSHHFMAFDAGAQRMLVFGGFHFRGTVNYGAASGFVQGFDFSRQRWIALAGAPQTLTRGYPGVRTVGRDSAFAWDPSARRAYVHGGFARPDLTSPIEGGAYFDGPSESWIDLPPTPAGIGTRYAPASGFVGGRFVIWGGRDFPGTTRDDGALYDPTTNSWTVVPPAPITARRRPIVASNDHALFVYGGYGPGGEALADGAIFDTRSNTWELLPSSPLGARADGRAQWIGNQVVVWGGLGPSPSALLEARNDGAIFIHE